MTAQTSHFRLYAIVACVAAATLGYELVQTRVLSALYYNHVVYLTVTIALLGFGISGVLISLIAERVRRPEAWITAFCAFFAISMLVSIYFASHLPAWFPYAPSYQKMFLSYFILIIPFLFSGAALGLIFMQHARNIHKLYCFDLIASAIAAAGFTLLLMPLGAPKFILLCVGLASIACLLAPKNTPYRTRILSVLAIGLIACTILMGKDFVGWKPEPYKTLTRTLANNLDHGARVEVTRWTPIARIDITSYPKVLTQDSDAHTDIPGPGTVQYIRGHAATGYLIHAPSLAYSVHGPVKNALIIGVGGGIDIVNAGAFGAEQIDAAEINPATVQLMTGPYANYIEWPKWNNVTLHRREGRHFVRSQPQTYDTIVMSAIDSFAALSSGAYVLSENYLYTVEAMMDYLKALKPGGVMAIHRWFFPKYPRESLRLASLYVEAARRLGIPNSEKSIMVITSLPWATTLIKKEPFTEAELARVGRNIAVNHYFAVAYLPKLYAPEKQQSLEATLWRSAEELAYARAAYQQIIHAPDEKERQRFMEENSADLSPVYDDRPFFFEYNKGFEFWRVFKGGLSQVRGIAPRGALLLLLASCMLISAVAMLGPLCVFQRKGLHTKGASLLIVFFSCLGLGFMMLEIGMMQRLSLYLGDPMYALIVTLASLLLFTGLGSFAAGGSRLSESALFRLGTLGIAAAVLVWLLLMPLVIQATLTWSFAARTILTLLFMLPAGLLMGIPFATGLRLIESRSPRFVPWAWGINGLTSVMASILAILLAMSFGFTVVLFIGAGIYVLGFVAIDRYLKSVFIPALNEMKAAAQKHLLAPCQND